MSDLNKILAFQQLMPYLSEEEQEALANTMGMDLDEINQRLIGKNKEDEFILILLFMNICESIAAFDEGVSQLLKTSTSDLLIELKDGRKFMLEIKHTDKEKYSISMKNLKDRIDFANKYNLDLYFAVSIKGLWMLFHSSYLQRKSGKINVSDYLKSELDDILGSTTYMFHPGLRIRSVYSTDPKAKTTWINFEPYGKLVSYEMYFNDKKIFRVKGKNSKNLIYTVLLEALQDCLANDTQKIEQSNSFTIINESLESYHFIPEYKFLLAPMEHTSYNINTKYTAHSYIEQAKVDQKLLNMRFTPEQIRGVLTFLSNNGVDISFVENKQIYKIGRQ